MVIWYYLSSGDNFGDAKIPTETPFGEQTWANMMRSMLLMLLSAIWIVGINAASPNRMISDMRKQIQLTAQVGIPNLNSSLSESVAISGRQRLNSTSSTNTVLSVSKDTVAAGREIIAQPVEIPQSSTTSDDGYDPPGIIPLNFHYLNVSQIKPIIGPYDSDLSPTFRIGYLTTNLTIGRPQQNFYVAVETGSNTMFIFDKKYSDIQRDQKTYDANASLSSERVGNIFWTQSGYAQVEGFEYVDSVSVLAPTRQYFGSIVRLSGFAGQSFPFDGVLGLGWNPQEKSIPGAFQVPIVNILQKMWTKAYTVYVKGAYSRLCYGTTTCAPCDWQIHYVPILSGFAVPMVILEQFSYGTVTDYMRYRATVDSDFAVILFPSTPYYRVYYAYSARLNTRLGVLMVKCNESWVNWKFVLGGKDYIISKEQYVVDIGLPNGDCALAAGKSEEKDGQYHLGIPFYQSFCVTFDISGRRVGFSSNSN